MPAVLGLRGSGSFSTDERPKNWREMLLYLFPNGEAPLTAVLSLLKSEGTDDPEYNWWEKRLPTQRFLVNGAQTNVETAIEVVASAKDAVKGTVLLVESTGELLLVTADPTTDVSLTVLRSYGAVAGTAIADQAAVTVIGNVQEEGALPPTAKSYSPTKLTNLTEIFRMPLYLTRTGRKTRLRWDNRGPYREAKREALSLHSIEMEKAFIFGEKVEDTGDLGMPRRMTGGVLSFLTSNKGGNFNIGGLLDEATLDERLEDVFRYGSNEKLCLAGSTFIRTITTLGKRNGLLQMTPRSESYGMKIVEYITPFGTLYIKNHPLFSQHVEWRKTALILDTQNLSSRPLDDTMFITNRQAPGEDASKDEYLTEIGLEVHYEETHAYFTNVTGALVQ